MFCVLRLEPLADVVLIFGGFWALFRASPVRLPVRPASVADPALAPWALRVVRVSPAVPGRGSLVSLVLVPGAPPGDALLADPVEVLPCVLVGAVGDRLLLLFRDTPDDILPDPLRCIPVVELVVGAWPDFDSVPCEVVWLGVCASSRVDRHSTRARPPNPEWFITLVE